MDIVGSTLSKMGIKNLILKILALWYEVDSHVSNMWYTRDLQEILLGIKIFEDIHYTMIVKTRDPFAEKNVGGVTRQGQALKQLDVNSFFM